MSRSLPALLLAVLIAAPALAEDADPPARVARLSLIAGEVSFQASGDGAPEEAELNRPLTWGDRLLTGRDARTEMSVGTAAIRLDQSTDLSIANLDEDIVQLELNSGVLGIHLRELRDGETFEIDTPNAAVVLREPGDYRIEVDPESATVLAVHSGEAELDGGAGPVRVGEQQELRFTGAEQLADVQPLGPLTAFDEWCIEREQLLADRETTRYVSREVVGYEDLDRHGSWWNEPGYGHVWAPTYVSIGWAPYRFGHWSWIGPWGFTWVDHAPWGYAPFHYGRWVHVRHRWCWVPGPRHVRPVWAPALVRWQGMPGVRDPSRPGSVSWFPLGPREVYVPTYRATPRHVRAVNVSNTTIVNHTQITNAWRGRLRDPRHANRDVPGAVSSLPSVAFAGDPLRGARVLRVSPLQPADTPHLAISQPVDQRRMVPRLPTDRRAVQSTPNVMGAPVEPSKFRRPEQPPKNLSELRRATPANSWKAPRQRDSGQALRNSDSGRSSRGDAIRASGSSERSVSRSGDSRQSGSRSQSGGESRMSGSSSQSGRGGSAHTGRGGGESRMSGSSGSRSGRTGGVSARP